MGLKNDMDVSPGRVSHYFLNGMGKRDINAIFKCAFCSLLLVIIGKKTSEL
jgi:hypothetical protein